MLFIFKFSEIFIFFSYIFNNGDNMESILDKFESMIFGLPLIIILLITHIYFTLKLKFPQFKIFKALKGILYNKESKNGNITPFKSLMTILAGTLGTGNIIGIASAIIVGGVGSLFWIFVSGVLAIATKYAETYIVLKYRKKKNKKYIGGAMYILDEIVGKKNLAIMFSIFLIISTLCMGAMMQSNAISSTSSNLIKIDTKYIAIIVTILSGYIVFGNEKRIAKVSSILVPIATGIYLISSILILIYFRVNILESIKLIVKEAMNFKAVSGGMLGSAFIIALKEGLSKGLFTNEAGIGTSPIFDVNVENEDIIKQSLISASSVFIDTVVLCSLTGILFVSSSLYTGVNNAEVLSIIVYDTLPYGKEILMFFLSIFAFSTIPCSCYYGWSAVNYLFSNKKIYELLYKIIYLLFVFIGANTSLTLVWKAATIVNVFLMIPNIYMLFCLRKDIEI